MEKTNTGLNLFIFATSNRTTSNALSNINPTNNTISDTEMLALLRGGNRAFEQGFRMLMAKYRERLYWHIRRMVGTHSDADDVLQNTFVKVYKGIGQFEGKSALYTWLYRIATNEAITYLQQQGRRATESIDAGEFALASRLRADEWFDGDAAQVLLQESIALLPEKQRAVFNLRYFQEMPYEEMSGLLDTSVGALKASFHHAVKKIEAMLEK